MSLTEKETAEYAFDLQVGLRVHTFAGMANETIAS
jgi:hypothetical protein